MPYSKDNIIADLQHHLQDYSTASLNRLISAITRAMLTLSGGDWRDLERRETVATAAASHEYAVLSLKIRELLSVAGADGRKLTKNQSFDQWNSSLDTQGEPDEYYLQGKGTLFLMKKIPSGAENITLTILKDTSDPLDYSDGWKPVIEHLTLFFFYPDGSPEKQQEWELYQGLIKPKLEREVIDRTFYERTEETVMQRYVREVQILLADDTPKGREKAETCICKAVAEFAETALWRDLIIYKQVVTVKPSPYPTDISSYNIGELLSVTDGSGNKLARIMNYDQWHVKSETGAAPTKYYLETNVYDAGAYKTNLYTADADDKKPVQTDLYLTFRKDTRDPADFGSSWREPIVELALHRMFPAGSKESGAALGRSKELLVPRLAADVIDRLFYDRSSDSYVQAIQTRLQDDNPAVRERLESCLASAVYALSGEANWSDLKTEITHNTVKDEKKSTVTTPLRALTSAVATWGQLRVYEKEEVDKYVPDPDSGEKGEPNGCYLLDKDTICFIDDVPDAVYPIRLTGYKLTSDPDDFSYLLKEAIIQRTLQLFYKSGSQEQLGAEHLADNLLKSLKPGSDRSQAGVDSMTPDNQQMTSNIFKYGRGGM